MNKKLTILLVITNLITIIFLWIQFKENEEIKRDILGQYIMSQHNIHNHLTNALQHYENGDIERFTDNLYLTSKEYIVATQVLGEGNPIGRHVSIPDSIWRSHWSDMNLINQAYQKAVKEELNVEALEEIKSYSEKMKRITEQMHYEKLTSGRSPKQIVEQIEKIIEENK